MDDIWKKNLLKPQFAFVVNTIKHIIETIYSYGGIEHISLCFNGGKDCTVLLHLLAYILSKQFKKNLSSIPIVYFKVEREFDELYHFNNDMMKFYNFQLIELDGKNMKHCLEDMLKLFPQNHVIFMGQRSTDPHGAKLTTVQKSDPSWPPIDRANSILSWTYAQVWDFLISFELPYCRLYELGFTSLGSLLQTIPNPWLLKQKVFFS